MNIMRQRFGILSLLALAIASSCFPATSVHASEDPKATTPSATSPAASPAAAIQIEGPSSRADVQKLFTTGNELFRAGLEKVKTDRPAAESLFREAAAAWRTVAMSGNIHNVRLETNIANASLLGGDIPRAIAAYRRALAIDPLDADVRNGLSAARRAAGTDSLAPGTSSAKSGTNGDGGIAGTARGIISFVASGATRVESYLPYKFLFFAACTFYLGAFVMGIAKVSRFNRISAWIPSLSFVVGILCAAPLIARELNARSTKEAVVVQPNIVARSGPAELYDPAFKEPLRPGVEATVEETRSGWTKIRLGDGRVAWIPSGGLEPI